MRSRKTIFELERRKDLFADYNNVISDVDSALVTSKSLSSMKLIQLLDECIKTWPYRQAANSMDSFAKAHGFEYNNPGKEMDVIYSYELLINLLYWAQECENNSRTSFDWNEQSTITKETLRCIENIEYNLEMVNMRVRKIDTENAPKYVVSKRDTDVDAVIEAVPELSAALLSYLDVRNQKDEASKKATLKAIADYLEPRRKSKYYQGTSYNGLCEELFTVFNNAAIRHNNDKQWKLRKLERMKLYDQTFKAAVHLMQMEDVKAFAEHVSELKNKASGLTD